MTGDTERRPAVEKVNLLEKFGHFQEQYKPKIVGDLNDHQVKVVKFQGDFVWHHHENEDELFLVMKGRMTMGLRTGDVELSEGEMFIVPKGVEHRPTAKDECWIVLIEPATTLNTGNVRGERTVAVLDRI
jgi:mannose-6-phosphate isomerase-like protein (cupin superfamily)